MSLGLQIGIAIAGLFAFLLILIAIAFIMYSAAKSGRGERGYSSRGTSGIIFDNSRFERV